MLLVYTILLIAALVAISRGADLFIDAATGLGRKIGLTEYLIGSLMVGVGTSLPELVTSLSAVFEQQPELVGPNVYGTVTANILAGLGLSAVFLRVGFRKRPFPRLFSLYRIPGDSHIDFRGANALDAAVPIAIFSVLLSFLVCADGVFSRGDALIFLACYVIFLLTEMNKLPAKTEPAAEERPAEQPPSPRRERRYLSAIPALFADRAMRRTILSHLALLVCFGALAVALDRMGKPLDPAIVITLVCLSAVLLLDLALAATWRHEHPDSSFAELKEAKLAESGSLFLIAYLAISLILVFAVGDLIIEGVLQVAEALNIATTTLTASLVAFGTSLPDILVAIKVARRGWHKMLIGHILQSNVFDVLFIMAVCGLATPLPMNAQTLQLTLPVAIGAHLLLLVTLQDQRMSAAEGGLLTIGYLAFVGILFGGI